MSEAVVVTTEPEKTSRKFVLLGAVLVLVVAAVAGWWLFLKPAAAEEPPAAADGEIVALDPLTTTLGVDSPSHARVSLAIVLVEGADPAAIQPRTPLLQDALLREVSGMRADQLRSSEGSDQLRAALTKDAKKIWGDDVIRRVVLTELLVQ
ncbi:flagellar basal body-associated protein FliL [Egicoccus sp. AB-alg2]|uniref:flagellar basal body-associated FliL family protein n=1 Tax=Egicoccus sp. AB-alg2 TaxID=3242693 RepID=UPI00359D225C